MNQYTVNVIIGATVQIQVEAQDEDKAEAIAEDKIYNRLILGEETISSLGIGVVESEVVQQLTNINLLEVKEINQKLTLNQNLEKLLDKVTKQYKEKK